MRNRELDGEEATTTLQKDEETVKRRTRGKWYIYGDTSLIAMTNFVAIFSFCYFYLLLLLSLILFVIESVATNRI